MGTKYFVEAVWEIFKKLSRRSQIVVVLLVSVVWAGVAGLFFLEEVQRRLQRAVYYYSAFCATDQRIPLSSEARLDLIETADDIREKLETGLNQKFQLVVDKATPQAASGYNSWTLSQLAVALKLSDAARKDWIRARMKDWQGATTWIESDHDPSGKVPILAWGIFAQATEVPPVDLEQLTLLLSIQQEGGWAVYVDDKENPATYPTAMAVIALSAATEHKAVGPEDQRTRQAIQAGVDWLRQKHTAGRWRDYPAGGAVRPGTSALAIYAVNVGYDALGKGAESDRVRVNQSFLAALEPVDVESDFSEVSGKNVAFNRIDHARVFLYPSQLLGVSRSYRSGALSHRVAVLEWIEAVRDNVAESKDIATVQPWVAAEYLWAIDRVLENSTVRAPLWNAWARKLWAAKPWG